MGTVGKTQIGGGDIPLNFYVEVAKKNIIQHESISKYGENPDIDTVSLFEYLWDGGGTYVPPTEARLHNVASTSTLDAGTVLSSGTADSGTTTSMVDDSATFVSDGVVVGDYLLNDTRTELVALSDVTETTLTFVSGIRDPDDGDMGNAIEEDDAYRVVTNASTGAPIFYIIGLDVTFVRIMEFVVMSGQNNVPTVNDYTRQFRSRVFGPGTTGAVGTITSTAQTDGTISCQIIDGNNQSLMAIYTVPSDMTGHLIKWWGALSKKQNTSSNIRLRVGTLPEIAYVTQTRAVDNAGSSSFEYEFPVPLFLSGGADIWVEADSSSNDTGISGGFEILLVEN